MTTQQIEVFVNTRNPKQRGREYYQLCYGDEFGGMITTNVKIRGEVHVPLTSWISGKCILMDVKIPHNTNIISLSVHEDQQIGRIGDYELVKDFRISRGVYVSGLVRVSEHTNLNARIVVGYDLRIYGRTHLSLNSYKKTQKKSNYE